MKHPGIYIFSQSVCLNNYKNVSTISELDITIIIKMCNIFILF